MSTDKLHISDATPGHDTHSAVLNRLGYGDLLNRKGRTEFTIDTTKLNKSAANHGAILGAGTGAAIGAVAGAELAGDKSSATTKLLSTLAGTGIGGVGGYLIGSTLDNPEDDGLSIADKNTGLLNTVGMGAIGGAIGYGTSKYLIGARNKTHHLLSALIGAGAGVGAGSLITDSRINKANREIATSLADEYEVPEDKRDEFISNYVRQATKYNREKNDRSDWWFSPVSNTVANQFYGYVEPAEYALRSVGMRPGKVQESETRWAADLAEGGLKVGVPAYGIHVGKKKTMHLLHYLRNSPKYQLTGMFKSVIDAYNSGDKAGINTALEELYKHLKNNPGININNDISFKYGDFKSRGLRHAFDQILAMAPGKGADTGLIENLKNVSRRSSIFDLEKARRFMASLFHRKPKP